MVLTPGGAAPGGRRAPTAAAAQPGCRRKPSVQLDDQATGQAASLRVRADRMNRSLDVKRDQAVLDSFTHSGLKVGGWDQVNPGAVSFAGTTRTRPVTR